MSKACPCMRRSFNKKIRHSRKRAPPDIWSNFSKQSIIVTRWMWSTEILNQTISWLLSKTLFDWSILDWLLHRMLEKAWRRSRGHLTIWHQKWSRATTANSQIFGLSVSSCTHLSADIFLFRPTPNKRSSRRSVIVTTTSSIMSLEPCRQSVSTWSRSC